MRSLLLSTSVVLLLMSACSGDGSNNTDTATSGHITIAADESLRPIVEAEEMVFESLYPKAEIDIIYTSEAEAVKLMLTDSVRVAILTRHLTSDEKKYFDDKKLVPRYSPFANDAIALIMNRKSRDTVLTTDMLAGMLRGSISSWKQVDPSSPDRPVQVVFDNAGSGALRYLQDSLLKGAPLSKQCYALKDNPSVIAHVEQNEGSIGIIGLSWISDRDDSVSHGFLKRISVAELVPMNPSTAEAPTMKPYQAYVALKQYPLWRSIEIVNCTGRTGLGTGFASFIASDRGQRIVLKSGLVPANAPIRIVQFNNN